MQRQTLVVKNQNGESDIQIIQVGFIDFLEAFFPVGLGESLTKAIFPSLLYSNIHNYTGLLGLFSL